MSLSDRVFLYLLFFKRNPEPWSVGNLQTPVRVERQRERSLARPNKKIVVQEELGELDGVGDATVGSPHPASSASIRTIFDFVID